MNETPILISTLGCPVWNWPEGVEQIPVYRIVAHLQPLERRPRPHGWGALLRLALEDALQSPALQENPSVSQEFSLPSMALKVISPRILRPKQSYPLVLHCFGSLFQPQQLLRAILNLGQSPHLPPHLVGPVVVYGRETRMVSVAGRPWEMWPPPAPLIDFADLPDSIPSSVKIHFRSPLRITQNNQLVIQPDSSVLFDAIYRRLQQIAQHCQLSVGLPELPQTEITLQQSRLRRVSVTYQSHRHPHHVELRGVMGTMEFTGNLSHWIPLLSLAPVLQLGKNTALGLGSIEMEWQRDPGKTEMSCSDFSASRTNPV